MNGTNRGQMSEKCPPSGGQMLQKMLYKCTINVHHRIKLAERRI